LEILLGGKSLEGIWGEGGMTEKVREEEKGVSKVDFQELARDV
jgi:hypothetical protein